MAPAQRWRQFGVAVNQAQDMQLAIGWFKKQFAAEITSAVQGTPFHSDFLTALALQESYEIWGRAYTTKSVPEVLAICVGDILDAPARNPHAFPQNRAALQRAPNGPQMFKIARQALIDMAQVATEYQKYLKNPNKFCHAFGIFQYDIQAFTHDSGYFLNKQWGDFQACLAKCLMELHAAWSATFPRRAALTDTQLIYVAIAYNQGHADITKSIRQGYKAKGDTKYYGEYIRDYMALSKSTLPAP
jgi:hypothetical protein